MNHDNPNDCKYNKIVTFLGVNLIFFLECNIVKKLKNEANVKVNYYFYYYILNTCLVSLLQLEWTEWRDRKQEKNRP